jgi:hypothetical protein
MAQEQTQGPPPAMEPERQGSRWLYAPPPESDVKEWFDGQRLHDGMEHEPYYGGIVLIGAKEKINRTYSNAKGEWFIREEEHTVYVPYVKVDTRVAYFWTLVDRMNLAAGVEPGEERRYYGVIEPVPVKRVDNASSAYYNEFLPDGMFFYVGKGSDAATNRYICAQWEVAIYERQSYLRLLEAKSSARQGQRVQVPAVLRGVGTKQTLMGKKYADDNAIMKAETGAIGRALGVAGILVVGTGIATAEDIQESMAAAAMPTVNREGQDVGALPAIVGPAEAAAGARIEGPDAPPSAVGPVAEDEKSPQDVDADRREEATRLSATLKTQHPEAWEAYLHWYREERNFPSITELSGPALKGALVKLQRALADAQNPEAASGDAAAPPS